MKIRILNYKGQVLSIVNSDSHTKAIKTFSVNPVKKGKANEFDFVTYTTDGPIERNYWVFK